MRFSLGHVLAFLDGTLLNPLIAALIPLGLQFGTVDRVLFRRAKNRIFPFELTQLPPLQIKALAFVAATLLLRINRYLGQRARNNGVPDKFEPEREIVVVTGGAGVSIDNMKAYLHTLIHGLYRDLAQKPRRSLPLAVARLSFLTCLL